MRHQQTITPGERFGSLTVLGQGPNIGPSGACHRSMRCRCDCGAERTIRAFMVFSGRQVSCGCVKRRKASERLSTHGNLRRGELPGAYSSWRDMHQRCATVTHRQFPNYGGRGITVCERWRDFAAFLQDMGDRPPGMTIERIENDRGYEPGNCRWATKAEQTLNKRTSVRVEHAGRTLTIAEWSRETGLSQACLRGRLRLGWSIDTALSLPASHSNVVNPRTGRCAR